MICYCQNNILFRQIYGFKVIPIKVPMAFLKNFTDTAKIPEIHMEPQRLLVDKLIWRMRNRTEIVDFRTCHEAAVTTVWYKHKARSRANGK